MLALKCLFKDVEKIKRLLIEKSILNTSYLPKKNGSFFFFPLIRKIKESDKLVIEQIEVSSDFFIKKEKETNLKDLLSKSFSKDELDRLKTSFDVVGNIAILEIDDEFKDKEKIIADAVLKINKQIKTILAKSGIHEGVYRTQKMRFIAGIDTKETIYLENKTKIKLNVETVYFSSRLSEERKRISDLIIDGESIIEMFSGCAPYSLVISKNTSAKEICGIEINPDGHWYGLENIKLNNIDNVKLFCGDAKKLVPRINNLGIGLKGHFSNFNSIYFEGLQLFELQLKRKDLDENFNEICSFIDSLSEKGISVMLHHIPRYLDNDVSLVTDDLYSLEKKIDKFLLLSKKRNVIGFGLHVLDIFDKDEFCTVDENERYKEKIISNLKYLFKKYKSEGIQDKLYIENSIRSINDFETFKEIKKRTGLRNVVLDIVHLFISQIYPKNFKSIDFSEIDYVKYRKMILDFKKEFNVYFHIGDTIADFPYGRDAIEIGKGIIDFSKVIDLIDFGVIEVWDYFSAEYTENKNSYNSFCKIRDSVLGKKTFDRILMPLPKSAEDFLDEALLMSKKGTIIHFYDFLNEALGEIPSKAIEKINIACRRNNVSYKVLNHVKCGDQAPYVYRVCVDFEIV